MAQKKSRPTIPAAVLEWFQKTGAQGGKKRAKRMPKRKRIAQARAAAEARWKGKAKRAGTR